jgi:class 3 adenylate cyclase/tetratricopeptide (TPR) repeat protein
MAVSQRDLLRNWLTEHGLEGHLEAFERERLTLEQLAELSDDDLRDIGLTALGDRKRFRKALEKGVVPHEGARKGAGLDPTSKASPADPIANASGPERRQVTVMFSDLVGSTSLSAQMDPEDFRELLARYHQAASQEIQQAGGFVAKFLGDGVLAYFGYPRASEDDAERAVRAALALVRRLADAAPVSTDAGPNTHLAKTSRLQVRVGIATGLVVVGDLVAEGLAPERAVVGETPNLAARLQAAAEPGQVLIGLSTRRLVGEVFDLAECPPLLLKGFEDPIRAWQVLREREIASRFERQRASALTPFVGRDTEVAMLLDRWSLAADGEGQVVLLTGEAGIGKSRISAALRDRLAAERDGGPAPAVMLWQCSPLHRVTPLHPVVHQMRQAAVARVTGQPSPLEQLLDDCNAQGAPRARMLRMAGLDHQQAHPLPPEDPAVEKLATLEALTDLLVASASRRPVLALLEDAHWIDASTEELLAMCVPRLRTERILLLVTSRPGYEPSWHQAPHLTRLALSRMPQRQCVEIARQVAQDVARNVAGQWTLPPQLLQHIVQRTDGVPLFVEELTKAVLESGLPASLGLGDLSQLAIPSTLQDSLTARLDRLQPASREVAQAASVIGREFDEALLQEVLRPMSALQVNTALEELQNAELVYRSGAGARATASFKHALVRDASYGSLLKGPRAALHAKVARAIAATLPQLAAQQPELLAEHHQFAGESAEALACWRQAGDLAASRSSLVEAADHYRAAIALCPTVQPPAAAEFHLQLRLSSLLTQIEGYGSEEGLQAARRALVLAEGPDMGERWIEAVDAVGTTLASRGQVSESRALGSRVATGREPASALGQALQAWGMGGLAIISGQFEQARLSLEDSINLIDRHGDDQFTHLWGGTIPRVACLIWLERALMFSGRLEEGFTRAQEALEISRRMQHPPTLSWVLLNMVNWLHLAGRPREAAEAAKEAIGLSERYQIKARIAAVRMIQGRTLVMSGRKSEGAALMRSGIDQWLATCSVLTATLLVTGPAWAMASVGDLQGVQEYLDIGERLLRTTEERTGEAELLRVRAWTLKAQGDRDAARTTLHAALAVADRQHALFFALRVALDLVELDSEGEHRPAALATLRRVYASFDQGFGFTILQEAKRVLGENSLTA